MKDDVGQRQTLRQHADTRYIEATVFHRLRHLSLAHEVHDQIKTTQVSEQVDQVDIRARRAQGNPRHRVYLLKALFWLDELIKALVNHQFLRVDLTLGHELRHAWRVPGNPLVLRFRPAVVIAQFVLAGR